MIDTTRLASRLLDEGERTIQFFSQLTAEQQDIQIYTDGNCWAVKDILAHLLAAEISLYRLIVHISEGGHGSPEDFDLDAYNERKVLELRGIDVPELLERFRNERKLTIQLVLGFAEVDLEKRGRHPFLGTASLADIIKLMYRHHQIHIRDIRRMLALKNGNLPEDE